MSFSEPPGWEPSAAQQLLLQACLAPVDQASQAIRQWAEQPLHQRRDSGSRRLMPLLLRRCREIELPATLSAERASWKQEAMRTWQKNHRLLSCANRLAAGLESAGIPVLLIKGLPLALQAYGDLCVRPMADLDLAVPHRQARQAVEALTEAGWEPLPTPLKGSGDPLTGEGDEQRAEQLAWISRQRRVEDFSPLYFHVRHSHGFRHRDGLEVDLHWSIFQGQCDPERDDPLWEAAQSLAAINRIPQAPASPLLRTPEPAEHLLLLLAHGTRWNRIPPIRWIVDAVMLLRSTPELDWQRFHSRAQDRNLTLVGAELLTFLRDRFAPEIPLAVIEQLRSTARSSREHRLYRIECAAPGWRCGIEELRYLHRRYRLLRRRPDLRGSMAMPSWPVYLCHVLGAPGRRDLARYALSELERRRLPSTGLLRLCG